MNFNFLELLAFSKNQSCNKLLKIATEEQIVAEQQFWNIQSSFVICVFSPGAHSACKLSNLPFQRGGEAASTFIWRMWQLWGQGCTYNDKSHFCSSTVFCYIQGLTSLLEEGVCRRAAHCDVIFRVRNILMILAELLSQLNQFWLKCFFNIFPHFEK